MNANLFQQALAAQQSGNIAEAERLCLLAIAAPSDHENARRMLSMLAYQRGDIAGAESHIARAAALSKGDPAIHQNHAQLLTGLGRLDDAIAAAGRAIGMKPDFAAAYVIRGHAKAQGGHHAEALIDYKKAVSLGRFGDPSLFFGLGYSLAETGERENALDAFTRAIKLRPDFAEAHANRGLSLQALGRIEEALASFDRALALNPGNAENHSLRAGALVLLHRRQEAAAAFGQGLAIAPDQPVIWRNFANLLALDGQYEKALEAYDRAIALEPNLPLVRDMRLHAAMQICDWTDFEAQCAGLRAEMEMGRAVQPFALAAIPCPSALRLKAAKRLAAERAPQRSPIAPKPPRKPGRLRIAYVGAMFRNHPVSLLLAPVLRHHDRGQFEIFAVSHGADDGSDARRRIVEAAEHFIDMPHASDQDIAGRIAGLDIDIAIDLDGYTEDARPAILSYRPAPVQAQFLGFPGTMGAAHIDYLIGDAIVTPPEHQPYYTEQLVQLPQSYMPSSPRPQPAPLTRAEAGLPPEGIVFCGFTQPYKISPDTFASWMRILARVPGSVLWLRDGAEGYMRNLKKEAQAHGIDAARLFFAAHAGAAEYFARLRVCDLYLDTFIYGAHTTAGDALWSETPVVTRLGDAFPARVAASLLRAAGVGELVAPDTASYENLAVELAGDPARRARLRAHLRQERAQLFDSARFARHLENAFSQMKQRSEADKGPEGFTVSL